MYAYGAPSSSAENGGLCGGGDLPQPFDSFPEDALHRLDRSTSPGLARSLNHHRGYLSDARVLLLTSALWLTPAHVGATPASTAELTLAVQTSTEKLRKSWSSDPTTAQLPFPQVHLLPQGVDVIGACTPGAPAPEPAPTAIYCVRRAAVLLEHDMLVIAYRIHKTHAVDYWIAVGLAESVRPSHTTFTPAVTSLQTSCLAGVLLGATGSAQHADTTDRYVKAAAKAYGDQSSGLVGSSSQRAYAVLTGMGATGLDCSAAAMARLATGQVTINPDLGIRGPGSLGLEVSCRQPPACPRRLSSGVGVGGV